MSKHVNMYEALGVMVRLTAVSAATFFIVRQLIKYLDPTEKPKREARNTVRHLFDRLTHLGRQLPALNQLNDHELLIAQHLIYPEDIADTWSSIAGLDHIIEQMKEIVILPIARPDLFRDTALSHPPKGILLHGPPGCGKTMLARATAHQAACCFINLDVALLTDKWYGESQKLTKAVFSLAYKLQPCIIFIDEIDSFLRARTSRDHEATAMMKAQFMSLWDGLTSDDDATIIIMGATNRPHDLDPAILRRMPTTFYVPLPSEMQRAKIIELIMANEPKDDTLDYGELARRTDGFCGSDLKEMSRKAALCRVRDYLKENPNKTTQQTADNRNALRPIGMDDLVKACDEMRGSMVGRVRQDMMRIDVD